MSWPKGSSGRWSVHLARHLLRFLFERKSPLSRVGKVFVKVGVFLKAQSMFAEIRPKAGSLSLSVVLPRRVESPRTVRALRISADRTAHFVKLLTLDDVDVEVLGWLTEAYFAAGPEAGD